MIPSDRNSLAEGFTVTVACHLEIDLMGETPD